MFFKKQAPPPPAPSPQNEEQFIKWILRFSADLEPYRKMYSKNLDTFVNVNWISLQREIAEKELRSADALMRRAGEVSLLYEESFKPHVEKFGGVERCPGEFQTAAVMIMVKIHLYLYLAKNKYGAPIPEDLLDMTKAT